MECDVELGISKADRIVYGGSFPSRSLLITGVNLDNEGTPTKFRVENSLSSESGDSDCKFLIMSRQWFEEFIFSVVVEKKNLGEEVLNVFDTQPSILSAWDPIGKLAI